MSLRVLDLFSGIGGFSLGLERTGGFRTVAFCEIEEFPRRVLRKHWPDVPCYDDVRTLTAERLRADGIAVDVICGGFPCQDISIAGAGAGLDGERSGLWREYARLIGEIRPRYVIVENVAALLARGVGRVLGNLAALGYDAEWHCIPASAVGAPHERDRLWIVAYPDDGQREQPDGALRAGRNALGRSGEALGHPDCHDGRPGRAWGFDPASPRQPEPERALQVPPYVTGGVGWWESEPDVGRVAHGVPSRVDRLRALGNAVVPQIPELIGHAILAREAAA